MADPLEQEFKQVIETWEQEADFYIPDHLVDVLVDLLASRARHLLDE